VSEPLPPEIRAILVDRREKVIKSQDHAKAWLRTSEEQVAEARLVLDRQARELDAIDSVLSEDQS